MISEVWMIIATIVSPIIAVQVTRYLDEKKEKRGRKLDVFKTLMATRANTVSVTHVEALNRIDLEFAEGGQHEKNVVRRWREYLDLLSNKSIPVEQWSIKRLDLLVDLLFEMGVALGYDFDKVQIKNGTYAPVAHSKIEEESQLIRENLIKILEGSKSINVNVLGADKS